MIHSPPPREARRSAVSAPGLAALVVLAGVVAPALAQCPSYRDRPRISATVLWRDRDSSRTYPARGATVELIDPRGKTIRRGYADRDGKVSFANLPVGSTLRVRSTYGGQTRFALDHLNRVVVYSIHRCDAHSPRVFHVF